MVYSIFNMYIIGWFVILYYLFGGAYFSLIHYRKRGRYLPLFDGDNDSDSDSDIGTDAGEDSVTDAGEDSCILLEPSAYLINIY